LLCKRASLALVFFLILLASEASKFLNLKDKIKRVALQASKQSFI
jgi:hypothetical protein